MDDSAAVWKLATARGVEDERGHEQDIAGLAFADVGGIGCEFGDG